MTKKLWIAVLAIAGLLALPILASAAHWPNFGGDAGRSGFQPVNMGALPLKFKFHQGFTGEPGTSPVITDAPAGTPPHVAFATMRSAATADPTDDPATQTHTCEVHFFKLDTSGSRVGSPSNVCGGNGQDDTFGTPGSGSVTPVSSSGNGDFGQLFVLFNRDNASARGAGGLAVPSNNDIAIAQYDEKTGALVSMRAVGAPKSSPVDDTTGLTNGLKVDSSPVITPPLSSNGNRELFFIARNNSATAPNRFLIRVTLPAAAGREALNSATFSEAVRVDGANHLASPTIASLADPISGNHELYVLVPGTDKITSFKVSNLSAGPAATRNPDASAWGTAQTVSVPVTSAGDIPSGGPALYAAFGTMIDGQAQTVVRKFTQNRGGSLEVTATSSGLKGTPSRSLAVNDLADAPSAAGRVVVTTSRNLYALSAADLTRTAVLQDEDAGESLLAGTNGFARTSPAIGGDRVYVTRDNGRQLVLRLSDLERVCRQADVGTLAGCTQTEFAESSANDGATFGIGQPALSRRMSAFLSDKGLFVYEASTQPPVADFSMIPNPVQQGQAVTFDATASKDPDGSVVRYEWDLDGNGEFETDLGKEPKFTTFASKEGTYNVQLRVTDNEGATHVAQKQLVVNPPPPNQAPTAAFAVAPNPAKTGERVSFDGRASKDPDGTIAKYEWDLDGNGSFETVTTTPTASRTFAQAGVFLTKLRVTDNAGGTAEATQQLVVTRAGRVAAKKLTARVKPRSDTTLPHRFRVRGRLVLPDSVSKSRGCRGRVTIVVKNRKQTISRRTTKLRRTCRYKQRVTFDEPERLEGARKLRFKARFQGNRSVLPRQAKTRRARISN